MSLSNVTADVRAFMAVGGQGTPNEIQTLTPVPGLASIGEVVARLASIEGQAAPGDSDAIKLARLRARLILEEAAETVHALGKGDMVEYADGLADLIYVTVGAGLAHGVPLEAVWNAVQAANMAKFPVCATCNGDPDYGRCPTCNGNLRVAERDAGGKVVKPPGWTPPDIDGVLKRHAGRTARRAQRAAWEEYAERLRADMSAGDPTVVPTEEPPAE